MTAIRYSTILATLFFVAWFLLPQVEYRWLSEEELVVLSYAGYGATLPLNGWYGWTYFAVTIFVLLLVWRHGASVKWLYVCYLAVSTVLLAPFTGIVSETGLSIVFRDMTTLCFGVILALMFVFESGLNSKPVADEDA